MADEEKCWWHCDGWYFGVDLGILGRACGLHRDDINSFTLVFAGIALMLARGGGVGTCIIMTQLQISIVALTWWGLRTS
jgi:hypothetical protein